MFAVADRVIEFAHELGVDNDCIHKARAVADGSHRLVAADFDRNEYVSGLDASVLPWRPDGAPADASAAWSSTTVDQDLAGRWRALGALPPDAIGRRVHEFYVAWKFAFPGEHGSAPPLLAQHDWVHVVADFGTTVESELEVFGFIARASDDPRAFGLLAMAVTLFQTGTLSSAAGIFEADAGHLAETGMPARLADAMRRRASARAASTSSASTGSNWPSATCPTCATTSACRRSPPTPSGRDRSVHGTRAGSA